MNTDRLRSFGEKIRDNVKLEHVINVACLAGEVLLLKKIPVRSKMGRVLVRAAPAVAAYVLKRISEAKDERRNFEAR